jgi:hypothetical protein
MEHMQRELSHIYLDTGLSQFQITLSCPALTLEEEHFVDNWDTLVKKTSRIVFEEPDME